VILVNASLPACNTQSQMNALIANRPPLFASNLCRRPASMLGFLC
jgi:hypothetical protein